MNMNLAEYAQFDGLGLAELVRAGQVSRREMVRTFTSAVEKVNPRLNAVIDVYSDLVEDPERGGFQDGPFAGVPFLRKDLGAAEAGRLQEYGSRIAQGFIPDGDSFLTKRFKRAGLMILGRSAIPEFALSSSTETVVHGETHNPWAPNLMAGGSSGGAAAAVASGIVPMAHASDGAGSIRIPASCCGLVGLKVSRGRVTQGPELGEGLSGLAVEFILSRSVRDAAAMLDAVSDPAPGDPFVIRQPEKSYLAAVGVPLTESLRVGYCVQPWTDYPVADEVVEGVKAVAAQCERMGHTVEEVRFSYDFNEYIRALTQAWAPSTADGARFFAERFGREISSEYLEPVTLSMVELGRRLDVAELMRSFEVFNRLRRKSGVLFEEFDLLLTPTLGLPPQPLGKYSQDKDMDAIQFFALCDDIGQFLPLFNITGQPAISLPLWWSEEGLPLGMQFVGRFGEEETLIRVASAFEDDMPWRNRIPAVHVSRD
jgi:amidase